MAYSPFIKITLAFVVGILLGFLLKIQLTPLFIICPILIAFFSIAFIRSRKMLFNNALFGTTTYLIFVFIGIFTVSLHSPLNNPKHYINKVETVSEKSNILASVQEKLKPTKFQDKYILKIEKINGNNAVGKVLLNIQKSPKTVQFSAGKILVINSRLKTLQKPLNPYVFDYANYMEHLGVFKELNSQPDEILKLNHRQSGLKTIASNFRDRTITKLRKKGFNKDEMAVIQALLLGQRQEVSAQLYSNYAAAGVIHILALSGLHVGILLLFLNFLLKPLENIRWGKFIKTLLLILLLWAYAFVAGLSASVVRAVTMFTFVAIGMQMNRKTSVLQSLFISLLLLLLVNPNYIFQVGFQLSYLAVLSIALFQPLLSNLYSPGNRIILYLWNIFTVTLAAQIGVLPLSLFYFHQFPGLFFISNLIILPFLGVLLGIGFLVIIFSIFGILPDFLTGIFAELISLLNQFVKFMAVQEKFIFRDVYFPLLFCIGLYLVVVCMYWLWKRKSAKQLLVLLLGIVCFQLILLYEKRENSTSELLVFQKSRSNIIGIKHKNQLQIYSKNIDSLPNFIEDYVTARNIQKIEESRILNVFSFQKNKILVIDSNAVFKIPEFNPEYILLINSPKVNLDRVISTLKPQFIIADGSNFKTYANLWKKTCALKEIHFYNTAEKGFFRLQE